MDIKSARASGTSPGVAEGILEQFEGYGNYLQSSRGGALVMFLDSASAPTGIANIGADGLKAAEQVSIGTANEVRGFGPLGRMLGKIGAVVDGAAGISELAQTFAAERQRTDLASRLNVATLGKSIEVTGRISATSIIGAGVCTAVATATGLTVLPIVAGAAAGVVAGYAVGKLAEGMRWGYGRVFGE